MVLGQPFTWFREEGPQGGEQDTGTREKNRGRQHRRRVDRRRHASGRKNPAATTTTEGRTNEPARFLKSTPDSLQVLEKKNTGARLGSSSLVRFSDPLRHLGLAATRFEVLGEDGGVGVGVVAADYDKAVQVQLLYYLIEKRYMSTNKCVFQRRGRWFERKDGKRERRGAQEARIREDARVQRLTNAVVNRMRGDGCAFRGGRLLQIDLSTGWSSVAQIR